MAEIASKSESPDWDVPLERTRKNRVLRHAVWTELAPPRHSFLACANAYVNDVFSSQYQSSSSEEHPSGKADVTVFPHHVNFQGEQDDWRRANQSIGA